MDDHDPEPDPRDLVTRALKEVLGKFGVEVGEVQIYRIYYPAPNVDVIDVPMKSLKEFQPGSRFWVELPLKWDNKESSQVSSLEQVLSCSLLQCP